ncbi:hypothetical protein LT493_16335 [Streptomyces tricolor]|nr:hypothetical protein [Streptomyces tricolor]
MAVAGRALAPGAVEAMADAFRSLLERLAANGPEMDGRAPRLVPEEQLARRARTNATKTPVPGGLLHTPSSSRPGCVRTPPR